MVEPESQEDEVFGPESQHEEVGVETEAQKIEREVAEVQLKNESELMEREDFIVKRVALRINQIDWELIGEADFDEEDDLTKIEGINSFVERKLNALEIKSYEQISKLDVINMKIINDAIEFPPDRILKQEWVEKATYLLNDLLS